MSDLLTPRRKDGSFPFEYRNSASTDVAETWRLAREKFEEEKRKREEARREISNLATFRRS